MHVQTRQKAKYLLFLNKHIFNRDKPFPAPVTTATLPLKSIFPAINLNLWSSSVVCYMNFELQLAHAVVHSVKVQMLTDRKYNQQNINFVIKMYVNLIFEMF